MNPYPSVAGLEVELKAMQAQSIEKSQREAKEQRSSRFQAETEDGGNNSSSDEVDGRDTTG